jgi:cyclase
MTACCFRSKLFTPDYRYTANFVDAWSIDEIVLLDITRPERRDAALSLSPYVNDFSRKCFVPLCVGGGKCVTLLTSSAIFDLGADKVAINTVALRSAGIHYRRRQAVWQSIRRWCRSTPGASVLIMSCIVTVVAKATDWAPEHLARRVEELGAGEILLTSIDSRWFLEGYDNVLNARVAHSVKIT